ncbi:MAG: hypothetical protein ACLFTK_04255, partial [Anaerolineales bacterium]
MWILNVNETGSDADTYLDALNNQDAYENIVPLILPVIALTQQDREVTAGELRFSAIMENLSQDDWNAIAQDIIPGDYLQEQAETNLPRFFDYINGEKAILNVEFNTGILRDNLAGQPGDRMVNRIFSSWEDCTPAETEQVRAFLAEETSAFPYCQPDDPALQRQVFTLLNDAKDELATQIPERFNVREEYAERNNLTLTEADIFFYESYQRPNVLQNETVLLYILMPLSLLALILIVAVDSTKTFLAWMGWPLILAGGLALLPLAILPVFLPSLDFSNDAQDLNAIQAEALRGFIVSILSTFSTPILLQGAMVVGVRFLFVMV